MSFHTHIDTRIELYLVFPDTHLPWKYGRWYSHLDLPPGIYWRQHRGKSIRREERKVRPGETVELVALEISEGQHSYYGLLHGLARQLHILHRVRLIADDTCTDLFQSPLYFSWKAEGSLQDFDLYPWLPLPVTPPSQR